MIDVLGNFFCFQGSVLLAATLPHLAPPPIAKKRKEEKESERQGKSPVPPQVSCGRLLSV